MRGLGRGLGGGLTKEGDDVEGVALEVFGGRDSFAVAVDPDDIAVMALTAALFSIAIGGFTMLGIKGTWFEGVEVATRLEGVEAEVVTNGGFV
jgi:hypothetical protein